MFARDMNMWKKFMILQLAGIKWTKSVENLQPHEDAQILPQMWTIVIWQVYR